MMVEGFFHVKSHLYNIPFSLLAKVTFIVLITVIKLIFFKENDRVTTSLAFMTIKRES